MLANVSLASADPIGPPAAWPAAIAAWLAEARTFGWFPAVLSASEEGAQAYVAAGLKALPIGDEAIIDVDTFTLEGPTMQPVRQAVHRVQRAGYTISVRRHADLSAEQLAELARRAEDWRGEDTERGFSMALGRLGDPVDGGCVAVLAHDADGRLRGLLSMVPWGRRGLSLDLMRRDRTSENGLVEAMVAALVTACRDELGVRRLSLNFAMFRGVFSAAERVGAGPVVRLTSRVLTFASRFWQIESLYRSNARYLPSWLPRYLCYDSSLTLTRVALAAGMAEGFLPAVEGSGERAYDGRVVLDGRPVPFAEAVALQYRAVRSGTRPVRRLSQQQRVRHDKLARLVEAGRQPYPVSVPRSCEVAEPARALRRAAAGHPHRPAGLGGRPGAGAARLRRPDLRHPAGRHRGERQHPGADQPGRAGRRRAPAAALDGRPRRLPQRHRRDRHLPARRAVGAGDRLADGGQVPAPAARQPRRLRRPRGPGPAAARGPDRAIPRPCSC